MVSLASDVSSGEGQATSQGASDDPMLTCEGGGAQARGHGDRAKARLESLFARFDKDHDGKIALSDVPGHLRERLAKADANNDGQVTRDELSKAWEQKAAEMKKKIDVNGDGVISDQERAAARSKFWDTRFAKLDKNHDGFLTNDEVPPMMWDNVKVADANSDGKITRAEVDQAIASGKLQPPHHAGRKRSRA
jgi:Ca2+-binding EF-hand superfamily protein